MAQKVKQSYAVIDAIPSISLEKTNAEIGIYDANAKTGRIYINRTGMELCSGKVRQGNGIKKTWKEIESLFFQGCK